MAGIKWTAGLEMGLSEVLVLVDPGLPCYCYDTHQDIYMK